ncbi:MAG: type I restriction enzyme S subunit [Rhodobacteraceae bacterium]|uniref:restriction endonuclease subunit S n=1 Tax=Cypionkella sp. TaxID=2811411 RepID=UPI00132A08F9|nr:restriction endonuclease subunit S [Cypionkella sp.]KAF0170323.1 MAG: type I restriction enzyme S subunit [Paracoccaceae bacterium]MDO8327976.1 restriction endonuclease subunit S [Cypionkella sp.]
MSSLPVGWRLPTGWKMKPFGEVATLQRGFDLPVQDRQEGRIKIFAANGSVGTHNICQVRGPGVVTGRSGSIGKVHYVDEDFWPLNTALWVKDFHGNDPKWVSRILTWMDLEQYTRGVGVPTLNRNLVHEVSIPLPPLDEQKRIAAILDQADALRRLRTRALDRLNALGQAIFHEMFGDPISRQALPFSELGSLAHNLDGIRVPVKKSDRSELQGRFPYYGASGVIDFVDDFLFEGPHLLVAEDGANLLSRSTPIAFIADGQFWVNNHAHVLAYNGKAELDFLRFYLETLDLAPYITGSAQPKLNQKKLNQILVPVPPLSDQRRFVAVLRNLEGQTSKVQACQLATQALFTSLQHRAFQGEL